MAPTMAEVMQEKGITKYRLSKESGVPWATLSDIYNGKTKLEKCEAGTVRKLARALDMTVEGILDLETLEYISPETGKPYDRRYLEAGIPTQLKESIDRVVHGRESEDSLIDCYEEDLYSWLNIFYLDGVITKEQADYIRDKYYWGIEDDRFYKL